MFIDAEELIDVLSGRVYDKLKIKRQRHNRERSVVKRKPKLLVWPITTDARSAYEPIIVDVTGAQRGKTRASKARGVLMLVLIG